MVFETIGCACNTETHEEQCRRLFIIQEDLTLQALEKTLRSQEVGFQIGYGFAAEAYWSMVADQVFKINYWSLEPPLTWFFGREIMDLGDSKKRPFEIPGDGSISLQIIWQEFKMGACRDEFGRLHQLLFSNKSPMANRMVVKALNLRRGIGYLCRIIQG
ncbi:hypothetical protein SUGI_0098700 [Cryptomeria japonica]|nr:hypothetical protein SUGI_0098700 [Cryptomeria japonica]